MAMQVSVESCLDDNHLAIHRRQFFGQGPADMQPHRLIARDSTLSGYR
jgi:hypothetical protein